MPKHGENGRPRKGQRTPNIFVDLSKTRIAERRKAMLEEFRNFNKDAASLDDLVVLAAFGRALRAEYDAQKVDEPEFVSTQLNELRREIGTRIADKRSARVRELRAQRENLKTAAEKREAIEKELAELEAAGVTA